GFGGHVSAGAHDAINVVATGLGGFGKIGSPSGGDGDPTCKQSTDGVFVFGLGERVSHLDRLGWLVWPFLLFLLLVLEEGRWGPGGPGGWGCWGRIWGRR